MTTSVLSHRIRLDDEFLTGDPSTRSFVPLQSFPQSKSPSAEETATVSATIVEEPAPWLAKQLGRLYRLRSLGLNWESTGAAPPNESAVHAASTILVQLAKLGAAPTAVEPSSDEGVCITFREDSRYADFECYNNGEILAVIARDTDEPEVWEVEPGRLRETITRIDGFLSRE